MLSGVDVPGGAKPPMGMSGKFRTGTPLRQGFSSLAACNTHGQASMTSLYDTMSALAMGLLVKVMSPERASHADRSISVPAPIHVVPAIHNV